MGGCIHTGRRFGIVFIALLERCGWIMVPTIKVLNMEFADSLSSSLRSPSLLWELHADDTGSVHIYA